MWLCVMDAPRRSGAKSFCIFSRASSVSLPPTGTVRVAPVDLIAIHQLLEQVRLERPRFRVLVLDQHRLRLSVVPERPADLVDLGLHLLPAFHHGIHFP